MEIEVILSTNGNITVKGGGREGTFTKHQLYRLLKRENFIFKQPSQKIIIESKYYLDVPQKSRKGRSGDAYLSLYERIKDLGFTDKNLEHNILDIQKSGVIKEKWRRDGLVHIPSFIAEASEAEVLLVLNYKL